MRGFSRARSPGSTRRPNFLVRGKAWKTEKPKRSAAPATLAPAGSAPGHRKMKPGTKAILDFAPLLLFFVTSFIAHKILGKPANPTDLDPGLMWATIVFMPATVIALAITYAIERRVHAVPLVTAAIVLIFGGLTLALRDDFFIKIKPTISLRAPSWWFAVQSPFLKDVLSTAFDLDERGWRSLTVQWGPLFCRARHCQRGGAARSFDDRLDRVQGVGLHGAHFALLGLASLQARRPRSARRSSRQGRRMSASEFGRQLLPLWHLDPDATFLNHGSFGAVPREVLAVQTAVREEMERQPDQFFRRRVMPGGGGPDHVRENAAAIAGVRGSGRTPRGVGRKCDNRHHRCSGDAAALARR